MHTKLPIINFFQNSSFFVAWFSKNSRISFWIRNFMASCLSKHDQMVYSIFQNRAPQGVKFFQMISKWMKVFIKMDWLLTMITNPFEISIVQNLKIFSFFHFSSFIQTKTSSYFKKETEWETIFFLYFFRNFKTHIFVLTRVKFLES